MHLQRHRSQSQIGRHIKERESREFTLQNILNVICADLWIILYCKEYELQQQQQETLVERQGEQQQQQTEKGTYANGAYQNKNSSRGKCKAEKTRRWQAIHKNLHTLGRVLEGSSAASRVRGSPIKIRVLPRKWKWKRNQPSIRSKRENTLVFINLAIDQIIDQQLLVAGASAGGRGTCWDHKSWPHN